MESCWCVYYEFLFIEVDFGYVSGCFYGLWYDFEGLLICDWWKVLFF